MSRHVMRDWGLRMFALLMFACHAVFLPRPRVIVACWSGQADGEEKEAEPASSTAVLMAELCKLCCAIILQYRVSWAGYPFCSWKIPSQDTHARKWIC